jgi:hypothetical protein
MGIVVLRQPASIDDVRQMLQEYRDYIKFAIDVRQRIAAGGGEAHYDCEQVLLEEGCQQSDIWCSGYRSATQEFTHDSIVNVRPRDGNAAMEIQDEALKLLIREIIIELIGDACNALY